MPWFRKYFLHSPEGDAGGGGGGGNETAPDAAAIAKENADLKQKIADLEAKWKGGGTGNEPNLTDRAREQREADAKKSGDISAIESAMRFTLSSKDFLKANEGILPAEVADIFAAAEREKFDSAVQKASAIKDGVITEYFKVQANLDLLTAAQKNSIENYLKLTKNGREEKAQHVFENILEPTLESFKRIKKAEEVNRAKNGFGSDSDRAYKEKLISGSRKHYIGEKK